MTNLHVGNGPAQVGTGGGRTSQVSIGGAVANRLIENLPVLEALPSRTETVTYKAGAATVTDTYTGPLLWDVLGSAGILTDAAIKNDILHKLVIATGSDGYQVGFSLEEIDPKFGDEPILVAYSDTAGRLANGHGFARLVVPGDIAGGRYVSNLASLTVFDPTTVPKAGSVLLLLVGVAGVAPARRAPGPHPTTAAPPSVSARSVRSD